VTQDNMSTFVDMYIWVITLLRHPVRPPAVSYWPLWFHTGPRGFLLPLCFLTVPL